VRFGLLVKMMIGGVTGWLIAQSRYQALQRDLEKVGGPGWDRMDCAAFCATSIPMFH
jgi:hypothetical protein